MMNLELMSVKPLTMSSREIAELTGKEHGHVKRDIEVMMQQLGGDVSKFGCIYLDSMNRKQTEYKLDRRHVDCLLTGYSPVLRMKVIDRWHELEAKQAPAVPRAYAEALLEAGRLALEVEKRDAQLAKAAPKIAFVDQFVDNSGSKSLRESAKILRMPERAMIEALVRDRVLYRQSGNLLPYSLHQKEGRFTVKTGTAETRHAYTQTRVTPRGLEWLANRYASELMVD